MDKFTASNGVSVMIPIEDPHEAVVRVVFEDEGGRSLRRFNADELSALREFSVHERDVELGRWRWPEKPHFVVYRDHRDGGFCVLDERTGDTWTYLWSVIKDDPAYCGPWDAARAYFAAHPEPKPWHDAKPGEVWVITTENVANEVAVQRTPDGAWQYNDGRVFADHGIEIATARRIFPEVSDD